MSFCRLLVCIPLLIVMLPAGAYAAREKIETISADPYVAALVIDADSGKVLIEEHADRTIYPASVLKLMVLLVLLDRIEQGTLALDDMVPVTVEAYKTGGSQVYLDPREQFSVDDMLYALIVQSANDAAVALAMHVAGSKQGFVELMNQRARELGMNSTHFHSVHGLPPAEGQEVDVTTARDLALLCRELVQKPRALLYTSTRVRDFRGGEMILRTHNHLLQKVDGCDGLKTGYFKAAGFSIAATATRGTRRVIALVLGSRDRKVRDARAGELIARGFSLLPQTPEPAAAPSVSQGAAPEMETEQTVPGTMAGPAISPGSEQVQMSEPKGKGWRMFLAGLLFGMVLTLAVQAIIGKRSKRGNRRYLRR